MIALCVGNLECIIWARSYPRRFLTGFLFVIMMIIMVVAIYLIVSNENRPLGTSIGIYDGAAIVALFVVALVVYLVPDGKWSDWCRQSEIWCRRRRQMWCPEKEEFVNEEEQRQEMERATKFKKSKRIDLSQFQTSHAQEEDPARTDLRHNKHHRPERSSSEQQHHHHHHHHHHHQHHQDVVIVAPSATAVASSTDDAVSEELKRDLEQLLNT